MTNIYVGNLSFDVTDASLQEAFAAFGAVDKANVVTDRMTGRSRGFGFVEMGNDEEAKAAIEGLNGSDLGGRTITVNLAKPREDRPRGGGGGGGGGRRW
ncbi:MAG: RNA-binding protein [Phycisphaerae bacterium]|nr:RNA-binding protein [Phycisphaerae bacterium]